MVWLRQYAPAYLVLVNIFFVNIEYQPEKLPQTSADQWLLASSRSKSGSKYAGENSWSNTYLQRVLCHVMDTLISGWNIL